MPTALEKGIDWGTAIDGAVVTYAFVEGGTWEGVAAHSWSGYEMQQFRLAFDLFESFLDISFLEVATGQNFTLVSGDDDDMGGALGWFNPPGTFNAGLGAFNRQGAGWDRNEPGSGGLEQGGYGFITIIHELGHGLGLAHPHDKGGTSSIFPGVGSAFNDYGDFDLNQGVYTMMSYNDGWRTNPDGKSPSRDYGYEGTPMAIDIAVLQAKYGANMGYHTGDNTYVLPAVNDTGTFYACIWDAGGRDRIVNNSDLPALIDLRAATLKVKPGGGGYISYADGIFGGFTIAHDVVIEDARGGSDADVLRGNSANNYLRGRSGDDRLIGAKGDDRLDGGNGSDKLSGGRGVDTYDFRQGPGHGVDTISKLETGEVLRIDGDAFAGIEGNGAGVLRSKYFVEASAAQDGNDHIVYWRDKGRLYYDPDGKGPDDQVLFARLHGKPDLDHGDILVI